MSALAGAGSVGRRGRAIAVLCLALIASVCYVTIRTGLRYAPPLYFGGLRALLAGVALLGLAGSTGRPVVPSRTLWPGTVALALTTTTITYGGMFLSPGRAGAGVAAVLGNVQPLVSVVLAALFLEERLTPRKMLPLLLGSLGLVLVAYPGYRDGGAAVGLGGVLALAASFGAATGSVLSKHLRLDDSLLAVTGTQFVLGSLPLLLLSVATEPVRQTTWSVAFVSILLFLALVGTAFVSAAWFWLLQRDEVGRLSLLLFVIPLLGLLFARLAFDEPIGATRASGAVLTALAILAILREDQGEAPPQSDRDPR